MTKEEARSKLWETYMFAKMGGKTWDDFCAAYPGPKGWAHAFVLMLQWAESDGAEFRELGWRW